MYKIHVSAKMRSNSATCEEKFHREYLSDGTLLETKEIIYENDYCNGTYKRQSPDNGRTWSEWETVFEDTEDKRHGAVPGSEYGDEYLCNPFLSNSVDEVYHPQSGCTVGVDGTFYYLNGHNKGYFDMWKKGEDNVRHHAYFKFTRPDGTKVRRMFEFEEGGADYDPANPRNPAFIDKNRVIGESVRILPDGDVCVELWPTMTLCCKIAGVDVNTFFPSCPNLQSGLIYARGHWNPDTQDFVFTYSNPIMLSDLQSSRGMMEPRLAILPGGRWLVVFRGSNLCHKPWNTRISPAAPGFKWYTYSDDGGKTFAPPQPWHFDTREVVYSPASISDFFRSGKNGKLYWIGNIIDEPWRVQGNNPRWPLQICQVDETHGYLLKDTLTVIDTVRDGQTSVDLTNFNIVENPETLALELRLSKVNFNGERQEENAWYSEAWEYIITFEGESEETASTTLSV